MNPAYRRSILVSSVLASAGAPIAIGRVAAPEARDAQPAPDPGPRAHHAMVYDERARRVVLSGGSTSTDGSRFIQYDDTWTWDGKTWVKLDVRGPAISSHRMVYDSDRRRVLMLSGYDGARPLGLLRRLDTASWNPIADDSFLVRSEPAAAYDTRRKRLVVYGGATAPDAVLSDTWEFDGSRWMRIDAAGPGPLQGASMVYDAARGVTILFGGSGPDRALSDRMWSWDGTRWTAIEARTPPARAAAGMTFDARRSEIILFGGIGPGFTSLGDTWLWNGREWRQSTSPGPGKRSMGYLAYDRSRDVTVLFGGRIAFPRDGADTWEWNGSAWTRVR